MKNLDLNKYGVQEMNEMEMKAVEGGCLAFIVAAVWYGIMLILDAIIN